MKAPSAGSQSKEGRVFYLHTSTRLDSGTVFYTITGEARAKLLLQLFYKQYASDSTGNRFLMTPAEEVEPAEQILLQEALDWLEIYDDPDPGIYDPPPTQDIMDRAEYARQAHSWDAYVPAQNAEATNESTDTQPLGAPEAAPKSPKVFISYSHDSKEHRERVLLLSDRHRAEGINCHIDMYEESPPQGWPRWCDKQIREAAFVLVACTETYLRRFQGEEEYGSGQGGTWEGHIITQELYNAQGSNYKFIPIIFRSEDSEFIPIPLQSATHYSLPGQYDDLYRRLTNQPLVVKPLLGKMKSMPPRQMPALPVLKSRQSFVPQAESFSHEETIRTGGENLYNDLIADNFISHSVNAPHTTRDLIEEIARHSNRPIPIDSIGVSFSDQIAPRGRTFFGNPGDYLEQIVASHDNVRWWISSKGLNIHAETAERREG